MKKYYLTSVIPKAKFVYGKNLSYMIFTRKKLKHSVNHGEIYRNIYQIIYIDK